MTETFVPRTEEGAFVRAVSEFRHWVTADGAAGPSGEGGFEAASGRYHLYVSYACPWANRTLIMRTLKGLESHIDVSVVHPLMGPESWHFDDSYPGATVEPLFGAHLMAEVYRRANAHFDGVVTVPALWDRERATLVSNESSEIIRMFNRAFDGITGNRDDYYPDALRAEIDRWNERIYHTVNNGVYRAGFATTQTAYANAVGELFDTLDVLEAHLAERSFLVGDSLTEADIRLFPTLIRFDAVYVTHFKCNVRRLVDFPALQAYTERLYALPGVAETVRFDHIKDHYFQSHRSINPTGIVPVGPELAFR
ncbi:MAG: glutathione S-transferase family protein [Pseudomonadota bacterium]